MGSAVEQSLFTLGVLAVRQTLVVQFVRMGQVPSRAMWERAGIHSQALRRELLERELGGDVVAEAMAGRPEAAAPPEL